MPIDAFLENLDFINTYPNEMRNNSLSGASEIDHYLDRRDDADTSEENLFGDENFVLGIEVPTSHAEAKSTPRLRAGQSSLTRTP